MTPEGIERMLRTPLGRFILQALRQQEMNVALLRFDIAHLMARHQEDFDQGWPHHVMVPILGWPEFPQWQN